MNVPRTIAAYAGEYEALKKKNADTTAKRFRVALLSSFTITGLEPVLAVKAHEAGLDLETYVAGYDQYAQEILGDTSGLYRFDPDLTVLSVDLSEVAGDRLFFPYEISDEDRRIAVGKWGEYMAGLIDRVRDRTQGAVLVHDFSVPTYSPLGILEQRRPYGHLESIADLNRSLRVRYAKDPRVFVFDYDSFCSAIGKSAICDPKLRYLGDIRIGFDAMIRLADAYLGYIKPLCGLLKKCLVVDLDNTLWGGVLGEDGPEGIRLGSSGSGRPFVEFQKQLLALHRRGFLLAVNSRNNAADVDRVFAEHPDMVLKREHFSAMRINWEDKADNMASIARELNIGTDSLVFFDDDKAVCERVANSFPEIAVVCMPEDPSRYPSIIPSMNDLNTLALTEEDLVKGRMMAEQKGRAELEKSSQSLDEYLKGLQTRLFIKKAGRFEVPRVAQLTQKTNQFNMTTRRYSEDLVASMASDKGHLVLSIQAQDKFGDNGIIGVVILRKAAEDWYLDTFLLSCRVLGRKIEDAVLAYILGVCRAHGATRLLAEYIPTAKNEPAKDFYRRKGFDEADQGGLWYWPISRDWEPAPASIALEGEMKI